MTVTVPVSQVHDVAPRQLIVTLYGLYARAEHNWLSVASLVRLMADLGIDEPAVRSSVSRLKRRDTLRPLRLDGAAGYLLSPASLRVLREGDERIFHRRRATLAGGWVLLVFSVPEVDRDRRHELRTYLTRLGFGTAAPGVWIAPAHLAQETRDVLARHRLDAYVEMFRAEHLAFGDLAVGDLAVGDLTFGDLAAKVRQWWDLEELSARHVQFIDRYAGAREPGTSALTARDAFHRYVPMLTLWRTLPYLDPGLPLDLLPAGWPGELAAELFADLDASLREPAQRHAHTTLHPTP